MHGVIHLQFKNYVDTRHGAATWREILARLGIPRRLAYISIGQYEDEELRAIVQVLAERTRTAPDSVLEDFGRFLAPALIGAYSELIPPEWRTLDLLANAARSPAARPPSLQCRRSAEDEVVIIYSSPRKLCALAKGIVAGIARYYGEQINLLETSCMHRGHLACRLVVRATVTATIESGAAGGVSATGL